MRAAPAATNTTQGSTFGFLRVIAESTTLLLRPSYKDGSLPARAHGGLTRQAVQRTRTAKFSAFLSFTHRDVEDSRFGMHLCPRPQTKSLPRARKGDHLKHIARKHQGVHHRFLLRRERCQVDMMPRSPDLRLAATFIALGCRSPQKAAHRGDVSGRTESRVIAGNASDTGTQHAAAGNRNG